ncbi:peptidase M24 [Paraliobacillus quinghaiensis]|uniref:Peptidase M24 n=1 Tax=Paraliobacillus quinghaiensis TaxID=470815 RepID=A0A917WWG4_9BACI|nr:M23 family metallopeptidase [Paraliobacillus quinghaiensis]GGM35282.1 peptidase M24 [Paraliobacillus quinghaiensis]
MKKGLAYIAILAIVFSFSLPSTGIVSAESISDMKKDLNELEDNEKSLKSDSQSTEQKIKENEEKQDQVTSEINIINGNLEETQAKLTKKENEINTTNQEINKTETEIKQTEEEIEQLKVEIEDLLERIEKREELLKNRLRSMQQNGGDISYLQVLMGAQNFGDLINRITAVTKIMDQDKSIMESHKADKVDLETKKVAVEDKKTQLENDKANLEDKKATLVVQQEELNSIKATLDAQMVQKESLLAQLEEEHADLEEYKVTLADEQEILRKEQASLEKAIAAAREKQRLEQLANEKNNSNSNSNSGTSTPPVSTSGSFGWPADATYVSSEFNPYRRHPVYGYVRPHRGMDIARRGNVDIYASADGVVSMVNSEREPGMSGYGDMILITHYIDGKQYTTLYAHLRSGTTIVSEGQTVSRGQKIALMGNTGVGTGQHLHFEIHEGGWAHSNARNPRNYLK